MVQVSIGHRDGATIRESKQNSERQREWPLPNQCFEARVKPVRSLHQVRDVGGETLGGRGAERVVQRGQQVRRERSLPPIHLGSLIRHNLRVPMRGFEVQSPEAIHQRVEGEEQLEHLHPRGMSQDAGGMNIHSNSLSMCR